MTGQVQGVSTSSPFRVDTRDSGTEDFTLVEFRQQSEVTQNKGRYSSLTEIH